MNITIYQNEKVPINSLWRIGRKCLLSSQQSLDSSQQIKSAESFIFLTSARKDQTIIMWISLAVTFFQTTEAPTFPKSVRWVTLYHLFILLLEMHPWVTEKDLYKNNLLIIISPEETCQ